MRQRSTVEKPPEVMWIEIIFPCKTKTNHSADTKISIWTKKSPRKRKTNIKLFLHSNYTARKQHPPNSKQQK